MNQVKHSSRQKQRADLLLVLRGLAESRERAQALIMAGLVYGPLGRIAKAGTLLADSVELEVRGRLPFVSRGGLKLDHALGRFGIDVTSITALDIGASTGGFTDCLLQRGARHVYAVDVGHGQLSYKLRQDARVSVIETVQRPLSLRIARARRPGGHRRFVHFPIPGYTSRLGPPGKRPAGLGLGQTSVRGPQGAGGTRRRHQGPKSTRRDARQDGQLVGVPRTAGAEHLPFPHTGRRGKRGVLHNARNVGAPLVRLGNHKDSPLRDRFVFYAVSGS